MTKPNAERGGSDIPVSDSWGKMSFRAKVKEHFDDFISLIFPNLCVCCNNNLLKGEDLICVGCLLKLPKTNYHLEKDNILEKKFWGKADIQRVSSFVYYNKYSDIQILLNKLKYKGQKEIGQVLGKYAATDIVGSDFVNSVDLIVPVPLHHNRLKKRGYNQSLCIAQGLSEVMNIPIDHNNLYRAIENPTQTDKSTYERWKNTEGIFELKNGNLFDNKHILLVDDVLTTGSTLIACIDAIKNKSNAKISIFTLASA